jgi:hypothetical protein
MPQGPGLKRLDRLIDSSPSMPWIRRIRSDAPPTRTERMIRGLSLALLASVEPWMAIASAQTGISQYPYCAQGADNPGWSGCSYNTMGACQADASGTDSECLANPWYRAGGSAAPQPQERPIGANDPLPVGPPPNLLTRSSGSTARSSGRPRWSVYQFSLRATRAFIVARSR